MSKDKNRIAARSSNGTRGSKDSSGGATITLDKSRRGVYVVFDDKLKNKSDSDSNVKMLVGIGRDKDGKVVVRE